MELLWDLNLYIQKIDYHNGYNGNNGNNEAKDFKLTVHIEWFNIICKEINILV